MVVRRLKMLSSPVPQKSSSKAEVLPRRSFPGPRPPRAPRRAPPRGSQPSEGAPPPLLCSRGLPRGPRSGRTCPASTEGDPPRGGRAPPCRLSFPARARTARTRTEGSRARALGRPRSLSEPRGLAPLGGGRGAGSRQRRGSLAGEAPALAPPPAPSLRGRGAALCPGRRPQGRGGGAPLAPAWPLTRAEAAAPRSGLAPTPGLQQLLVQPLLPSGVFSSTEVSPTHV